MKHCSMCGHPIDVAPGHDLCEYCAAAEEAAARAHEECQAQQGNPNFLPAYFGRGVNIDAIRDFCGIDPFHPIAIAWTEMLLDADMSGYPDMYYSLAEYQDAAEGKVQERCNDDDLAIYEDWLESMGGWPDA